MWGWVGIAVLLSLPLLLGGAGLLVILMVRPLTGARHSGLAEVPDPGEDASTTPPPSPRR